MEIDSHFLDISSKRVGSCSKNAFPDDSANKSLNTATINRFNCKAEGTPPILYLFETKDMRWSLPSSRPYPPLMSTINPTINPTMMCSPTFDAYPAHSH